MDNVDEFNAIVQDLQKKEMNSINFKEAVEIVKEYENREYIKLEKKLMKLFDKFHDCILFSDFNKKTYELFLNISQFINELPDDVINKNIIFKKVKMFLNNDIIDSFTFSEKIMEEMKKGNNTVDMQVVLPNNLCHVALKWMKCNKTLVGPDGYKEWVDVLPKEEMYYYKKYNQISQTINRILLLLCKFKLNYNISMFSLSNRINSMRFDVTEDGKELIKVFVI